MFRFLSILIISTFLASQAAAAVWYVRTNGNDANSGNSWATSFQNIQKALNTANAGDEIWVAAGVYKPSATYGGATERFKTFLINKDLKIMGGFPASGNPALADRAPSSYLTTLSGDLGLANVNSDNAFHVVYIDHVSSAMILDGFRITNGNADDAVQFGGGGIYNNGSTAGISNPLLQQCRIENNFALKGGGFYNNARNGGNASPTFFNCVFASNGVNTGTNTGGAIFDDADNGVSIVALTGCTLQSNSSHFGGVMSGTAINGTADHVFESCGFTGNAAVNGGALYYENTSGTVNVNSIFCKYSNNTASQNGGAAYFNISGANTLMNYNSGRDTFSANTAIEDGGAIYRSVGNGAKNSSKLFRCLVYNNSARNGGAYFGKGKNTNPGFDPDSKMDNCIFYGNSATQRGGATAWGDNTDSYTNIFDCTFYGNTAALGGGVVGITSSNNIPGPTMNRSITWQNSSTFGQSAAGTGSMILYVNMIQEAACPSGAICGGISYAYNVDPKFVNPAAHDFHLSKTSPARDAAAYGGGSQEDFDGELRRQGAGWDFGADEIPLECPGGIVYVDKDATGGSNDGTSWANAFTDLQSALTEANYCNNVDEIWVAEGTYFPTKGLISGNPASIPFYVSTNVKIFGGFSGAETQRDQRNWNNHVTILSGDIGILGNDSDNSINVLKLYECGDAEIDGFTIAKGKGYDNGGNGAGIYISGNSSHPANPIIRNCIIKDNKCGANSYGAGVYIAYTAAPVFENCSFSSNIAPGDSKGGAIYAEASFMSTECKPTIRNSYFSNNTASQGGAIYSTSANGGICEFRADFCTFNVNKALTKSGGAIFSNAQRLIVFDCVFSYNTAPTAGAIDVANGYIFSARCDFEGNSALTGSAGALNVSNQGVSTEAFIGPCTFKNNVAATNGGAMTMSASAGQSILSVLSSCTFSNNSAQNGGAFYHSGANFNALYLTIASCQFYKNTATQRGGAFCSGANNNPIPIKLYNCTFYNNTATVSGGAVGTSGFTAGQSDPMMKNCIATGNSSTFGQSASNQGGLILSYSLIQETACPAGLTCGNGMLYNKNPLFVNPAVNDFHLKACSPSVNTGDMADIFLWDFDGVTRPQGAGVDMGAFEYVGGECVPVQAICKNITVDLNSNGNVTVPANSVNNGSLGCDALTFQINNQATQSYSCAQIGIQTVTLKVTDCNGFTSICTSNITVRDAIKPTMLCKNATILLNASGQATLSVAEINNGSYDNCSLQNLSLSQSLFGCSNVGPNPVQLSGNDSSGNKAECTATVTVKDLVAPLAKCKNATANLNASGTVTLTTDLLNNGSSDNCTFTMQAIPAMLNCANVGLNSVTLRVTDASGNTTNCTSIVTVKDDTAPSALCKNAIVTLNETGQGTLNIAQINNGSSDACGIASMTINKTQFNCSEIPGGAQTVALSVKDINNNLASCLAQVTIKDATAPVAICENTTVQLGANGLVTVYPNQLAANSYDNCSVTNYLPVAKVYSAANMGNNNLNISVKDWSGNAATCISVVTVQPFSGFQGENVSRSNESEKIAEPNVLLFPNPTSGMAQLKFNLTDEQILTLRVFDLAGRMVMSRETAGLAGENSTLVDMSQAAPGVYFVDLQVNGVSVRKRLLVQRD